MYNQYTVIDNEFPSFMKGIFFLKGFHNFFLARFQGFDTKFYVFSGSEIRELNSVSLRLGFIEIKIEIKRITDQE